ncbi:MAG: dTDP-4-dehydrorhamnose 3,5-epimerase family protein [Enterococcus casseliflavus]
MNFLYKCDNYYNAEADGGIAFDDPDLDINWPIGREQAIMSEKDHHHPTLKVFEAENPFVYGEI